MLVQELIGERRADDALGILIGNRIGGGEHRNVYHCPLNTDYVVKIETTASSEKGIFANVHEWAIWCEMKNTKWAKWLAPCITISDNGLVLVQGRCERLERRPAKVPSFLADLKWDNWGTYNGRPVALDYGNHHCFTLVSDNAYLVSPKWHDVKVVQKQTPENRDKRKKNVKPKRVKRRAVKVKIVETQRRKPKPKANR